MFVANYGSGSVSAFALGSNGELKSSTSNIQHSARAFDPGRQEGPARALHHDGPTNKFVCAVDLGLDQVSSSTRSMQLPDRLPQPTIHSKLRLDSDQDISRFILMENMFL